MQFNRKALLKAVQDETVTASALRGAGITSATLRAAISQLPTEVTRPDEGR